MFRNKAKVESFESLFADLKAYYEKKGLEPFHRASVIDVGKCLISEWLIEKINTDINEPIKLFPALEVAHEANEEIEDLKDTWENKKTINDLNLITKMCSNLNEKLKAKESKPVAEPLCVTYSGIFSKSQLSILIVALHKKLIEVKARKDAALKRAKEPAEKAYTQGAVAGALYHLFPLEVGETIGSFLARKDGDSVAKTSRLAHTTAKLEWEKERERERELSRRK